MTRPSIIATLFILTVLTSFGQIRIIPRQIDSIELIQVDHPYLGERVNTKKLDDKLIADFLLDFGDKTEWVSKFYSCYVIKIHLNDGQFISYRTNGYLFEKFKDDNTTATYFKLNNDINLVTKYWGIDKDKFCATDDDKQLEAIKYKEQLDSVLKVMEENKKRNAERIVHQIDSVTETDKYIVYKTDTFNIRDNRGLIQGKGIWLLKDSTIYSGISSHTLGYHDNSKVATCVYHKDPDNVYYKVKEIFYGQYRDNLMTGIWTCNWTNGKRRIELTFDNGNAHGQVNLYYDTGELMYSGVAVNGRDKIELKRFTKGGLQSETNKYRLADIIDYLTY